jgi:TonB-dependent starch-binding outer membrane protein SusC
MSTSDYSIGSLKQFCFLILFFSISIFAFAQTRVTGKVTAEGKPFAGATVNVKGTTTATQTDNNGDFAILASPNSILEISAVGFTAVEIKVNNQSTVSVNLQTSSTQMEQVVVVGYGTQRRKDVTGAISSVSAATIEKVPVTTAQQALQGRAAGVQIINNDASPGSNISVLIRGVGSLASGGNNPLYVVDGYPTTGGINNINPNDIASIDVLKDASATAIYGIRAANGVVIITTKKGIRNKTQVSLDAYISVQDKPKEYNLLDAQQFATLSNEVEAADQTHS